MSPQNKITLSTSPRSVDQLAVEFQRNGAVLINPNELPLVDRDWQQLESILGSMEYEKVVGGDTGDAHSVWVGRFVNDVNEPVHLHPLTEKVLNILMNPAMDAFFSRITGESPLCVRRCQANRLMQGDFIGYHIDQDTTPDYKATAIFQLSGDYQGGEFIVHHPQVGDTAVDFPRYSVLMNRGDIPHQVKPVQKGMRSTLACFFSTNFGPTQKPRTPIKVDEQASV
jgi:hypothetical protein